MIDSLACVLVKGLSAFFCCLPAWVAVRIGEWLGLIAGCLESKRRHIGQRNLRAAFDGQFSDAKTRDVIRRCFAQLGAGFVELLRLGVMDKDYVDKYITIEGYSHLEAAVASKRPVILLTGHYGNWELASIVAALIGHPIVVLARLQRHLPKLYSLLVSYRQSKGCRVVHKGGAMRRLIAALDQGGLVGIAADQASRQGIFVDFFGRQALFNTGPFELAYSRQAWVIPVFIHRVRGPFHRIVLESAFTLSKDHAKPDAIQEGLNRFADLLARHIREDPSQWLWMHKRWKHTPDRRVLILSDGKPGHVKQSLAVFEAMREHQPHISHHVVEIRYRNRWCRTLALLWALALGRWTRVCLRLTLTDSSAQALLSRYADFIIGCGSSTVAANSLWASENGAQSIVIMNPAPFAPHRFSLVIAPQHDELPKRSNVVVVPGALNGIREEQLKQARQRLLSHPRFRSESDGISHHPVIALFIGGDTPVCVVDVPFVEALVAQVRTASVWQAGRYLVTSSRRTQPAVEQALGAGVEKDNRCSLLILASRDLLDGTMEGMLGLADITVVTGESISMVSEACSSGKPVIVVEPPLRHPHRQGATKQHRFVTDLAKQGYIHLHPVDELAHAIRRLLETRPSVKRLDSLGPVREALTRLLKT